MADFSNFGAKQVDLVAPGVDVLSAWLDGEYMVMSGKIVRRAGLEGGVPGSWG